MERNIKKNLIVILLIANLVFTCGLAVYLFGAGDSGDSGSLTFEGMTQKYKYTMYIGTNNKDTYTQKIPTEKVSEIVDAICAEHTGGYTTFRARGGWVDEKGILTRENTLSMMSLTHRSKPSWTTCWSS